MPPIPHKMNLKTISTIFLLSVTTIAIRSQSASTPYKGIFECKNARISLKLDAYQESVEVPGLSFLGKTHGYLNGMGIYGVWMITHCKKQGDAVQLRFSNDTGSDAQTILFKQINDSTFLYKATGGNVIKKVQNRKLVKIEDTLEFKKIL